MRKNIVFVISLCVVLLSFPMVVFSEMSIEEIIEEITETLENRLNLTPEQMAVIQSELDNQKTQRKVYADQEKAKKQAIEDELSSSSVDVATVDALTAQLNTIREDVLTLRKNTANNIKNVLTAEQLEVIDEIKVNESKKLDPEPEYSVDIQFYSIVCTDPTDIPSWEGQSIDILSNTAADFISANPTCDYASDWTFQWGDQNAITYDDSHEGEALESDGWTSTEATAGSNGVRVENIDIENKTRLEVRVNWKSGYRPFDSGVAHGSKLFCDDDVENADNLEWIEPLADGDEYTCIFFTAAE